MYDLKSRKLDDEQEMTMAETNTCECGSKDFHVDDTRGEITCNVCGLVLSDHLLDHGREKQFFTPEERRKREHVGNPLRNLLPDMGLSTTMDKKAKLSARKKMTFYRLNKIQNNLSWKKKHLSIAMNEIKRLCGQLSLSYQVSEASATFYRKIFKKDLLKGRSIKSMVVVSIYICCRQANIPITLSELDDLSSEPTKIIRKSYKTVLRAFNLKINPISPIDLITRIGGPLKISNKIEQDAREILRRAMNVKPFSGVDPKGLTCASIYLSSVKNDEKISQKDIARAGNVTEVTLRNRTKDLTKILTQNDVSDTKEI